MKSKQDYAEPLVEEESGLLSRWQKRKQDVLLKEQEDEVNKQLAEEPVEEEVLLTDADMPAIETLTEDSDYTGFLSPKVSESLRKLALRKLFHGAEFNIRDGLDEYDGDYTKFEALGDIITSDMKHQIEVEAQKKLQEAKDNLINDEADEAEEQVAELQNPELKAEGSIEPETEQSSEITSTHDEDDLDDEVIG